MTKNPNMRLQKRIIRMPLNPRRASFAWKRAVPAITFACLASTVEAAESTSNVQDRLQQLESAVETLKKENQSLREQIGLPEKGSLVVVRPNGKEDKLMVGGLIQAQGEFGKAPDARFPAADRFLLRRTRVNLQGGFRENFEFKIEGEFGNGSVGGNTGYRAQLTDAFIAWNRYDFAGLKIGQFKTPFGYEQLVSDPKTLTVERSLPNDRLTLGRQIGLGVSGEFLENRLTYSAGLFNGNGVNNGFNDNENFTYVGRVAGIPFKGKWKEQTIEWTLGVNGYVADDAGVSTPGFGFDSTPATAAADNSFAGDRTAWGADTQLAFGRVGLQSEYLRAQFEPLSNLPATELDGEGWYLLAYYNILPKKLQGLVKFESFDPDTNRSGNSSDVWTFGLTYFVKGDDLKFQLNYLLGNPADQPNEYEGRLLARMQLVF
jgi:phosphate-selective porin OprO and OprP